MQLVQIAYSSRPAPFFGPEDIEAVLDVSRVNNAAHGITGFLAMRSDLVIQILEGEEAAVEALFERIRRDDRHERIEIFAKRAIDRRSFPDWTMGYCSLPQSDVPSFIRWGEDGFTLHEADMDDVVAFLGELGSRHGDWGGVTESR